MSAPEAIDRPQLRQGAAVPLFLLPSSAGGRAGPAAMRSKYNLVLAFVDDSESGRDYLRDLAETYRDIVSQQSRLLAVVPAAPVDAQRLARALALPFPLLADETGSVTRRMLGAVNHAALCVADRYGELFYLEVCPIVDRLPPPVVALDWLEYIQIQCPE